MVILAPGPAKAHRLPLAAWVWSGFPGFTSHLGFLWGLARAAHPSSSLPSSFVGLGGRSGGTGAAGQPESFVKDGAFVAVAVNENEDSADDDDEDDDDDDDDSGCCGDAANEDEDDDEEGGGNDEDANDDDAADDDDDDDDDGDGKGAGGVCNAVPFVSSRSLASAKS